MDEPTNKSKVSGILKESKVPLSLEEICLKAFGSLTTKNRGAVRVALFRLDLEGGLVKFPRAYALKKEPRSRKT
jgi:hypothetical protein